MGRLFKEVFKSLARNKITLICLTILIFLTSGIFTLFFDVKTSYSNTIIPQEMFLMVVLIKLMMKINLQKNLIISEQLRQIIFLTIH